MRVQSAFMPKPGPPMIAGMDSTCSPINTDFVFSRNTPNVGAAFSYDWNENIQLTVDAINLTNQPVRRRAYQDTPVTTVYLSTGRQVFVAFRLKY